MAPPRNVMLQIGVPSPHGSSVSRYCRLSRSTRASTESRSRQCRGCGGILVLKKIPDPDLTAGIEERQQPRVMVRVLMRENHHIYRRMIEPERIQQLAHAPC